LLLASYNLLIFVAVLVAQGVEKAAKKDIVGQKEGSIQFCWP
jgi:hypothetical protein